MGTKLDLNGNNLILDADADTYLDGGTADDVVDVYVAGAKDWKFGANSINVLSGTTLTIDSGATITNSGTATGFGGADPSSADGDTLGTASAEWSDLYLADGGQILFGNDQDITLTHSADSGLLLKHTATTDDKPINLVLQTGETDIAADDVIGKISFQAPDEGTGTDAILVSGAIQAVAEGDHSASSNATRLEFMTGASEAATAKMKLSSGGDLTVTAGNVVIGTSGKGIDFSATADSSGTMTSELLDDYEEGTFTPTASGADSYTTQLGIYTKVGNLVSIYVHLAFAISSGTCWVGGLPFTANSTGGYYPTGSFFGIVGVEDFGDGTIAPQIAPSGTEIQLYVQDNSSSNNYDSFDSGHVASSVTFRLSITYAT
jgi:hypothetical protein